MQEKLRALVIRHCETLKVEADAITRALSAAGPDLAGDRHAILAAAHKLKGSSGSLGFSKVSADAQNLETVLRSAVERPLTESERDDVIASAAVLQERITHIVPEQSSLFSRVIQ